MTDEAIKTVTDIIKNIIEIIALLIAGIIAIRINWKFVPIIYLDITNEWLDQENGKLKLKLSIENKSNVKAVKKSVRLQILEYDLDKVNLLSEWVPFQDNRIKPNEIPNLWKEPVDVWETTQAIYPGEVTSLDYMCHCPTNKLVHVALFFEGRPDFFRQIFNLTESWCTTKIIANKLLDKK